MEKGKLRSLLSISMSTAIQEEQEKMSSFSFSLEEEARLAQSASQCMSLCAGDLEFHS